MGIAVRSRARSVAAAIGLVAVLLLVVVIVGSVALAPLAPQPFSAVRAQYRASEAYLLDRNGQVLDTRRLEFGHRRLEWTRLPDISPALIQAVVQGEDQRYWQHAGVDWLGALSATRDVVVAHRRRGASTITMQLASLLDAPGTARGSTRGFAQKLRQVRLALGLELVWSKQEILEAYLNLLPFRGELQGIRAASQVLVHKAPSGLSATESRILAALLPSPGAPPGQVAERACARLRSAEPAAPCVALQETAARVLTGTEDGGSADRLAPQLATALLRHAGERVATTLDADVQRLARDAVARQLAGLAARNVRDGAVLVVDNASGDVLAYVGSAGPVSRSSQVDGVRAQRQAGSTLKPFLYELALERHYVTAASLLEDAPLNIDTASGIYLPQDYDHDYKGLVSVRTALGGSLNVPAVRTLMLVGVEPFRERLQQLGYAGITQEGEFYGYSLALGSAEVSLWEQARAYRTLAQAGQSSGLRLRQSDPRPAVHGLLPADASFLVGDILSDRSARAVTFGLNNALATDYWSAVKTGTSKDMRDNWCIGYTEHFTVAVWVGNFEGDPMHNVSGVTGAAPIWRDIMDALQRRAGSAAATAPPGLRSVPVHFASGSEPPRREWFLDGTAPRTPIRAVERSALLARISSPANGMVIALDPDIPADRQRIPVVVQGGAEGLVLSLDGAALGEAGRSVLWEPVKGAHRVALEDSGGQVVDRILFTVR